MAARKRLDQALVDQKYADDITKARAFIGAGLVLVNTRNDYKAGSLIPADAELVVKSRPRFVSRGGDKLDGGLSELGIDVKGWVCADIGCSTGGFTDCLLYRSAAKVYCVDVGYGLLDWKLRRDDRVVVLERTNARYISKKEIPEPLDFTVIDASFISLGRLLEPLLPLFASKVRILALVKPQFELPRSSVGVGGIVQESDLHLEAMERVKRFGREIGLHFVAGVASSLRGAKGNQEFLLYFTS